MLDTEAIDTLCAIASSEINEIEGVNFHVSHHGAQAVKFPVPNAIEVFSLSQLVTLLENCYAGEAKDTLVNVTDFSRVEVILKDYGPNNEVLKFAFADFSGVFEKFPFGQRIIQEDFIIKLMTQFVKDQNRDELIKTVLSIKSEKLSTSEDDGYSQVAATKSGVHLATTKRIENLWVLKTFCTFPEIDQPEIPYILRLHQKDSEAPQFALYPCDGGKWKVDLTLKIRQWLINGLKPILGEKYGKAVVVL